MRPHRLTALSRVRTAPRPLVVTDDRLDWEREVSHTHQSNRQRTHALGATRDRPPPHQKAKLDHRQLWPPRLAPSASNQDCGRTRTRIVPRLGGTRLAGGGWDPRGQQRSFLRGDAVPVREAPHVGVDQDHRWGHPAQRRGLAHRRRSLRPRNRDRCGDSGRDRVAALDGFSFGSAAAESGAVRPGSPDGDNAGVSFGL